MKKSNEVKLIPECMIRWVLSDSSLYREVGKNPGSEDEREH